MILYENMFLHGSSGQKFWALEEENKLFIAVFTVCMYIFISDKILYKNMFLRSGLGLIGTFSQKSL
jgi:hypothetical protein